MSEFIFSFAVNIIASIVGGCIVVILDRLITKRFMKKNDAPTKGSSFE